MPTVDGSIGGKPVTEATERERGMSDPQETREQSSALRSRVVAVPRRIGSRDRAQSTQSPEASEAVEDTAPPEPAANPESGLQIRPVDEPTDGVPGEDDEEPDPSPRTEEFTYAPWETPPGARPQQRKAPKSGWRGALYGLSGKKVNVGLSSAEYEMEQWLAKVRTPVNTHSITTMNVKGGAGKTTTAMALGTVLATYRQDRCIGIDANPDRGNLAQRVGQEHTYTVRDLLDNLNRITGDNELRRFTNQAPSRFEVIASDRDPVKARAFTPDEYRTVQQVVRAFRQVIITDTGIDLTNPVVEAVLELTDTLVIAASTAQDVAGLAWETLETVEQRGYGKLVENAIVAIVKAPGGDQVPIPALESAFKQRCRGVVVIPHERSLVGGGWFDWDALSGRTKRAYVELAAKVAGGFGRPRQ
jgi:MinD-like ATPase involved in chromosome partitioning or flagellar assembly